MIKLKPGVKLHNLQPQIVLAVMVAESIYAAHDTELVVTSANDSTHGHGSLHFSGNAIDLRTRNFSGDVNRLRNRLRDALGFEYDVGWSRTTSTSNTSRRTHDAAWGALFYLTGRGAAL